MTSETLHLKLTASARLRQHRSHLTPALMLIITGGQALLHGEHEHMWVDLLSVALGLTLMVAFTREFRRKSGHHHGRVGWFDVIAGLVIMMEGFEKIHPGKWFQPGTLLMTVGAVTVLIGFQHQRLPKLRRLKCTDQGFSIRTRPFAWLSMPWERVEGIELEDTRLIIRRAGTTPRRFNLSRIENRAEVAEMLRRHWEEHKEMATTEQ